MALGSRINNENELQQASLDTSNKRGVFIKGNGTNGWRKMWWEIDAI